MGLPSTPLDEGTSKSQPLPEGLMLNTMWIKPSQLDLRYRPLTNTKERLLLKWSWILNLWVTDIQALLELNIEETQTYHSTETPTEELVSQEHQSPSPYKGPLESSKVKEIDASNSRNLQHISKVLYAQVVEDHWEKHKEAEASYDDLRAIVEGYYEENVDYRDQTDKLMKKTMNHLDKISQAGVDERAKLLKTMNNVSETLEVDTTLKEVMQKMALSNNTTFGNLTRGKLSNVETTKEAETEHGEKEPEVEDDPVTLVRVPYEIHGKLYHLTKEEIQAHLDKEEKIGQAAKEARLNKPELIKVVHEEAAKAGVDPKILASTKGGPYTPSTIIIPAVPAIDDSPEVPEQTVVETILNMSPENKEHYQSEKEAIRLLLTGIRDEIYSTVDDCKIAHDMWIAIERLQQGESLNIQDVKTNLLWEFGKFTSHDRESMESYYSRFYKMMNEMIRNNLIQHHDLDTVSYHNLFDVLKQYQKEVNEIHAERIAKNANPLALVAAAQPYPDPYYQAPKYHKSYAPPSKQASSTRSNASTKYKGKERAKPITPPSESNSEEDSDPKQAQRDKDMQKNLALIAKYFKKIYKPTMALRTRSSSNLVGNSSSNPTTSNLKRRNRRRSKQPFSLEESPVVTMADQRTMAELLNAPTEGYAEAIVVPPTLAEHFELKSESH
ncbi:hypothetical protein Tco_1517489 [Tanacetum coccineum]